MLNELFPNRALREQIEEFKKNNKEVVKVNLRF